MTEAKVPDNTSDWKAIDIFLFSNGQQSSPPRKYHLETNQLDWWKSTLNYLAKAHYGSMHSMVDLYMVDGNKVETPMQLSHGTAYVAVIPPDVFITASYEKYLIKASRSWEKGQARRLSNTAVYTPVTQVETDNTSTNEKSISLIKPPEVNVVKQLRDGSVTLKTIVASRMDNQASVIVTPETTSHNVVKNAVLHLDRNKSSVIQRPATVKKINSLTSPPTTRKPSMKRRDSVKIVSDLPNDKNANICKLSPKSKIFKPTQKKKDPLPEAALNIAEEVIDDIKSSASIKEVGNNNLIDKSVESRMKDLCCKDLLGSDWYKTSISVNPDTLKSDIDRQGAVTELVNKNYQTKQSTEHKIVGGIDNEDTISLTSRMKIYESNLAQTLPIGKSKPEENVAVINKEGTVNLKLNIEIWNSPNDTKTPSNMLVKKDLLNIIRPKQYPEADKEGKLKEHDITSHIIANEISKCAEGNCKVIIVKCTCLDHSEDEYTNSAVTDNDKDNSCVVVLPKWKFGESFKSCHCKNDQTNVTASPYQMSSVIQPVKKAVSLISLLKHKVSHSEITSRNNSAQLNVETNTVHDKNEVTMVKRKSVAICEDQVMHPANKTEQEPQKLEKLDLEQPDLCVMEKDYVGIQHKTSDKNTQTDSCDVLLEARLQTDGHYSFHMPPLEMVKHFKH